METAVTEPAAVAAGQDRPRAATPLARLAGRPRAGLALALAGLLVALALAYGWYLAKGGIYSDDYALIAEITHPVKGGWWDAVQGLWARGAYRPVSVAYYAIVFKGLGANGTLNLAWSILVTAGFAGLLMGVLRTVGMRTVHALAVAAVFLATPMGDATVLWPSATPIRFAGLLYLAGLLLALRGLREPRLGRARRVHAGAIACYVASIWTYELTAALTAAGLLVYLAVAAPRRALRRWALDLVFAGLAMAWTRAKTPKKVQDLDMAWHHARLIAKQLWTLYGQLAVPGGSAALAGGLTIAAGAAGVALAVRARRGREDGPAAAEGRRWALTVLVATVYVAAAYIVFAPADWYYSPAAVNFGNRVSGVGVAPMVLMAYATVMTLACLALWRRPRWLPGATALGLLYALVLFVHHNGDLRAHERQYVQASRTALHALDTVQRAEPRVPHGTLVLTTGVPPLIAPDLPVLAYTWDLQGAVRIRYDDPTLDGFNAWQGLQCTKGQMTVVGGPPGTYGKVVLVDVTRQRGWAVDSPRDCRRIVRILSRPV